MVGRTRGLALVLALTSCSGEPALESRSPLHSFELDSVRISGEMLPAEGGVSTALIMTNLTDRQISFDGLDECFFVPEILAQSRGRLLWAAADSPLISECLPMMNVRPIEPLGSVRFTRFVELRDFDFSDLEARFRVLRADGSVVEITPR
jgi:hypothetical protein